MKKNPFIISSPYKPAGDQPTAIKQLVSERPGTSALLGVTGSGKTFSLAHVIAQQSNPVLIISPNKTLAAQLYEEFSLFFPKNKVCYFVSYYDYYQPESYLPAQDVYIPKETKINDELDRLRIESTASVISRTDTIIIASVSAIYSLGNPGDYRSLTIHLAVGQKISRKDLLDQLIAIQYQRNEIDKKAGTFQVNGGTITLRLSYQKDLVRLELFGDEIESIEFIDRQNYNVLSVVENILVFPAKHFVTTKEKRDHAIGLIEKDLQEALVPMENELYKERLRTRVLHDIDLLRETGFCSGIENYSRYFEGRQEGDAPFCLFDFFPDDFLLIIDESHITLPQFTGMYKGDRARKSSLIEFGFRLPSAYDNRPLKFEEIERYFKDVIFVSATPGPYELKHATSIAEQVIRPTGIFDPPISIVPRTGQLDHLLKEIRETTEKGFRTLVTVMTKRSAEDLAEYLELKKIKVCYLHSDIKAPDRSDLLQKLRMGTFDCLVGINLLREGLDLPEVAFVAIIDADLESFLRDARSLIQIIGRAARNAESKVVFYADKITKSMKKAIEETERRQIIQREYNAKHGITPTSVQREVVKSISQLHHAIAAASKKKSRKTKRKPKTVEEVSACIESLKITMKEAAETLNFEKAIETRNEIQDLEKKLQKLQKS
ncbi:excinuclease ABC subunit UvrB [Candidatus Babeliales bacterium]|nr:excinuclease ABC subunit UvrB [Candidatus Babeliales bacterium]